MVEILSRTIETKSHSGFQTMDNCLEAKNVSNSNCAILLIYRCGDQA